MRKLIIILGVLGAAVSAILVRYSTAPSTVLVFYRMLFAVVLLCPIILLSHRKEFRYLNLKLIAMCCVSGIFLGLHFTCYFQSLQYTSIAASVVLVDSEVFFVALGGLLIFREQLSRLGWLSIVITFVGSVVVAMGDAGTSSLLGDLLALAGALCSAVYTLIGRRCRKEMTTSMYTWFVYFFAGVTVLIATVGQKGGSVACQPGNLLVALGLTVFCTLLGHSIFSWGLKYEKASFVSTAKLLEPIFASIMGWIAFKEIPSMTAVIGGILIIFGIVMYIKWEQK